ncbi:hypothetical protein DSM112329_00593 [Paraconexibacter sp. AEG42_29]|uniref:Uncharacterized protein n=1 Tax=Paraconexibacter sp. AEG42_29 TaxID=2997339 RepID=A0AAU7AQX8_9ACTN
MPRPPRAAAALIVASCLLGLTFGAVGCGRDNAPPKRAEDKDSAATRQIPEDRAAANRAAMRDCAPPDDDLVSALPDDLELEPVENDPNLALLGDAAPSAEGVSLKQGGTLVGSIVAFPLLAGEEDTYTQTVLRTVRRRASVRRRTSVRVRKGRVGGVTATRIDVAPGGTLYIIRRDCRILEIRARTPRLAKDLALRLADQP